MSFVSNSIIYCNFNLKKPTPLKTQGDFETRLKIACKDAYIIMHDYGLDSNPAFSSKIYDNAMSIKNYNNSSFSYLNYTVAELTDFLLGYQKLLPDN